MVTDSRVEILQRLRTIEGHLKAVIEMTETGRPCEQILHQLNAVQSGLRVAAIRLILCQAECSQAIILDSSSSKKRIAELTRLQSLYSILLYYFNHPREVINE